MASEHTQEIHKPTHISASETGDDGADVSRVESEMSMVDQAIRDGVEEEKCVVAIYKTTKEQKEKFINHLTTCEYSLSISRHFKYGCLHMILLAYE